MGTEERFCSLCEGEGVVAKNFGIDAPGTPEIIPCPDCRRPTMDILGYHEVDWEAYNA